MNDAHTVTDTEATPDTDADKELGSNSHRRSHWDRLADGLADRWRSVPVLAIVAGLAVLFSQLSPVFITSRNLSNLAVQIVVTGILALGLIFVLLVAQIDLSVAAVSAVGGGIMGQLAINQDWNIWLAMAAAVAFGIVVGAIYGQLVTRTNAPAFIVTLGGALVFKGVLLILLPRAGQLPLAGSPVSEAVNDFLPSGVGFLLAFGAIAFYAAMHWHSAVQERATGMDGRVLRHHVIPVGAFAAVMLAVTGVFNSYRGLPVPVAVFFALLFVGWFVTTQTALGQSLYAIGGNREAARRAGINVPGVLTFAFMASTVLAVIAGMIAAGRVLGVSPQSGSDNLLLEAVAAAVIGGGSLFGGRGTVMAALLGALVIGMISNGLDLVGSSSQVKLIVQGLILVAAVVVDGLLTARSGEQ